MDWAGRDDVEGGQPWRRNEITIKEGSVPHHNTHVHPRQDVDRRRLDEDSDIRGGVWRDLNG